MLWVSFWFSFAIDCVCKHIYQKITVSSFACSNWERELAQGCVPHHDDAGCFNASWLSTYQQKCRCFPVVHVQRSCCSSRKPQLSTSPLLKIARNEGGGICTRLIEYSSKCPSPLLPQSSVQKRGTQFREFTAPVNLCVSLHAPLHNVSVTTLHVYATWYRAVWLALVSCRRDWMVGQWRKQLPSEERKKRKGEAGEKESM